MKMWFKGEYFEIDLPHYSELIGLPIDRIWHIPRNTKGVYLLMEKGKIKYVGQSGNLHSRIQSHKYGNNYDTIFYLIVENNWERFAIEQMYIDWFQPEYNIEGKCVKSV
jgi:excinuclease UvrABC nuclease subunit